jgi:hypothetical protein
MSSVIQKLCWEAGDTLGWGKEPGRAETPSLWKASHMLKEYLALHNKPVNRPTELLLLRPWALHPLVLLLSPARAVRPQTLNPQTPAITTRLSPSGLPSRDGQTFTISTRPHPSGLHRPAQACPISARTVPLKPAKLAIHIHGWYPICWPMPFRHARPTLQKLASSPQPKASTEGLWDSTHLPSTTTRLQSCLRDTQTGLDAKGVTSEQLTLQIYCSRTGDFFLFFFPLL